MNLCESNAAKNGHFQLQELFTHHSLTSQQTPKQMHFYESNFEIWWTLFGKFCWLIIEILEIRKNASMKPLLQWKSNPRYDLVVLGILGIRYCSEQNEKKFVERGMKTIYFHNTDTQQYNTNFTRTNHKKKQLAHLVLRKKKEWKEEGRWKEERKMVTRSLPTDPAWIADSSWLILIYENKGLWAGLRSLQT